MQNQTGPELFKDAKLTSFKTVIELSLCNKKWFTAPLKEIKAKINVPKFGKIHLKVHVIPDIKTHFLKISIEEN